MLAIVLVFKRKGCFVKFYIVWFNCVFVCMCMHVWWEKQTGTIKMLVNNCILANTTSTSHFLHSMFSVKQDKWPLYVCTMTWYTLSHHLYGNFCLYIKNFLSSHFTSHILSYRVLYCRIKESLNHSVTWLRVNMWGSNVDLTHIILLYFFYERSRITSPSKKKKKKKGPCFHDKAVLWWPDILGHGVMALIWALWL